MKYIEFYSKRIDYFCKKKGISITKLAQMSNLRQSTLNNIMNGDVKSPRTDTVHKIANALNMTLAEFLDFDGLNNFSFDDNDN